MDTRNKLSETAYFLDVLIQKQSDEKQFMYNLSAFLSAWKSVLDVMLYDFAEYYSMGLNREDKIMGHDFWIVAKAQKHREALQFVQWWKQKVGILSNNPLWKMRHTIVHRGYPEVKYRIYTPDSLSSGSIVIVKGEVVGYGDAIPTAIAKDIFEIKVKDLSEFIRMCKEGFALMANIVEEAEKTFKVEL